MRLEYDGRKPFERERKLTEIQDIEQFKDKLTNDAFGVDERQEVIDSLFDGLATTYLAGNVVKKGLSEMDPAQFIPIEEFADSVRAAATRLAKENSKDGEIITYSLYQKAIDITLAKKWDLRGEVINMKVPASVEQTSRETTENLSNAKGTASMVKEFIAANGIITTIIGMLTISPFQTVIFQALGVEKGAQGIQLAQIPAGIALFLELGIKAERILSILNGAKVATPLVEQQIAELSNSSEARAAALDTIGLDYNEFKRGNEFQDAQAIIEYVSQYYGRYGGLDRPNGHLTIDHWIAYMHVAQNQQTVRGALNTSSTFSPKFQAFKKQFGNVTPQNDNIFNSDSDGEKSNTKMFIQLASSTRAIKESSDGLYEDIIATFNFQLTDRDLCCLVQIFGKLGDPDIMRTIASLLRILATSLSGELVRIENLISRFLANLAQDALFEIMANVNEFYYKIAHKITKAFTVDYKNLSACSGMFTLGWALLHSVRTLFDQVNELLKDISGIIGDFGSANSGAWKIGADRRQLLGMARLLEVLSDRLDLANNCATDNRSTPSVDVTSISNQDREYDQAIFSILEETPPNLQISEEDRKKFFPNPPTFTSENLKFPFGIGPEQNSETLDPNCSEEAQQQRIDELVRNIQGALDETFNG
tara:strand:+ start:54064 stop:56013 length:1950 start_codon:yes stop_codon:yes gene_type:complete